MSKNNKSFMEYTKSGNYLPEFMKDFHDCKDFFKSINEFYQNDESYKQLQNSWRDNHVFVVDFFLYFLSQHGYKIQKIRSKIEFCDLHKTLSDQKEKRIKSFTKLLIEAGDQK